MSLWLLVDGISGPVAWAHGDPDHRKSASRSSCRGPLVSELSSSSFCGSRRVIDKQARKSDARGGRCGGSAGSNLSSASGSSRVPLPAYPAHRRLLPGRRYRYQLSVEGLSPLAGK